MAGAGFEPAPPKRLGPYPSALDHSATQPFIYKNIYISHRPDSNQRPRDYYIFFKCNITVPRSAN